MFELTGIVLFFSCLTSLFYKDIKNMLDIQLFYYLWCLKVFIVMDRTKKLVFNYFDMIYSGYKKHGSRPLYIESPYVLLEYKNEDGVVAFNYDTEADIINFQLSDFRTTMSMFGTTKNGMYDICREYIADKFNKPSAINAVIYARTIHEKFN